MCGTKNKCEGIELEISRQLERLQANTSVRYETSTVSRAMRQQIKSDDRIKRPV